LPQAIHFSVCTAFDGYEPEALGSVSASSTFRGQARTHNQHPLHNSRSISTFPLLAIRLPLSNFKKLQKVYQKRIFLPIPAFIGIFVYIPIGGDVITISIICEKMAEQKLIFNTLSSCRDFRIIRTGKDGYDAFTSAADLKPDIVIMDMNMCDINALDIAPLIKRKSPRTALMVFYSSGEEHLVSRAVKSGISGFLHKETDMDKLAVLVRIIALGGCYISSPIVYRIFSIVSELDRLPGSEEALIAFQHEKERIYREFSPTERSIMILTAHGRSDSDIADDLHINQGTVRNSLCAIRRKTGMENRTQIAIYALKYGLTSFDQIAGMTEQKKQ
jgi:DNA-binding NarL/FixJ family response regulator